MQYRFRLPPCVDSSLAQLDARWRLAAWLVLVLACGLLRQPFPNLAALFVAVLVTIAAGVPLGWLTGRMVSAGVVLAAFAVPLAGLGHLGEAAVIVLKGLTLTLLTACLIVTAPLERTARAAGHLGLPAVFVHVAVLTYRYLFLLGDEFQRLRTALRVRGFRNRPNSHSYRTIASATATMIIRGADRAERVAAAMRCRGFTGSFQTLDTDQTRGRDVLALMLALLVGTSLLVWDCYNTCRL